MSDFPPLFHAPFKHIVFRYCDQDLDYDINGVVIKLLKELIRFQDRLYQKDPIKVRNRGRCKLIEGIQFLTDALFFYKYRYSNKITLYLGKSQAEVCLRVERSV